MAQVVKNPDNTLTVTLTSAETKVLVRWATETSQPPAKRIEAVLTEILQGRRNDYRTRDLDAATPGQQAQIDTILGT